MDNNEKDLTETISSLIEKGTETFNKKTKNITDQIAKERKKLEIRSQIGQHERQLSKAYERIGKAYYDEKETGVASEDLTDVIALVRSNRKVVELLNEQLAQFEEKTEKVEETK